METPIQRTTPPSIPAEATEARPYPPSYMDRLMGAIKRLPLPYGLTYLVLFVVLSAINHLLGWADGWLPAYTLNPLAFLYPLWFCFPLAVMTYLNEVSRKALSEFRPLLDIPEAAVRQLEYEFTTMPQRGVILSGVFWTIWYLVFTYLFRELFVMLGIGLPVTIFYMVEGLLVFWTGSVIYYHSIRQMRLVDKTVRMAKQFNVFRLDPVYAFSTVTSRIGIAWAILLALTLLFFPIQLALVPALTLWAIQLVLVTAAFILPLRVVNQRLVAEKRRLLAEHGERVETTLAELHRSIDEKALKQVAELNSAITGLNAEREILSKIPTWPWRAGLLTGFLTIVVFPILLVLIQLLLARLLGN